MFLCPVYWGFAHLGSGNADTLTGWQRTILEYCKKERKKLLSQFSRLFWCSRKREGFQWSGNCPVLWNAGAEAACSVSVCCVLVPLCAVEWLAAFMTLDRGGQSIINCVMSPSPYPDQSFGLLALLLGVRGAPWGPFLVPASEEPWGWTYRTFIPTWILLR